jgi:hypothetical protein
MRARATRRRFLAHTSGGLGLAALKTLLVPERAEGASGPSGRADTGRVTGLHFPARAKRIIYLFMAGGPSHVDLFDPKPVLERRHGEALPESVRNSERLTLMTRDQKQHLCAGATAGFHRRGRSGTEMSELLPYTGRVADSLCLIRSMYTEPVNHDPAVTFMQTGSPDAGRPSLGSWLSYGLGSENDDFPAFVVLLSGRTTQPLLSRYWHSGFLPSHHQGMQFRSQGDPVLYLSNPKGVGRLGRRRIVSAVNELNRLNFEEVGDPEIETRIEAFELAYRMQASVPELMDISRESSRVREAYGVERHEAGGASFSRNCLLARRLVERGVRFVQLYHAGWDNHSNLRRDLRRQCLQTDQPVAALLEDLKQRGMFDDTLVVWGGEFGRTSYSQGDLGPGSGRDHHAGCFSVWMAGAGVRPGMVYGATDDFGYNVAENPMHTHDLQATILHLLGVDHERLIHRFKGRDFRLTDVSGEVVQPLLS